MSRGCGGGPAGHASCSWLAPLRALLLLLVPLRVRQRRQSGTASTDRFRRRHPLSGTRSTSRSPHITGSRLSCFWQMEVDSEFGNGLMFHAFHGSAQVVLVNGAIFSAACATARWSIADRRWQRATLGSLRRKASSHARKASSNGFLRILGSLPPQACSSERLIQFFAGSLCGKGPTTQSRTQTDSVLCSPNPGRPTGCVARLCVGNRMRTANVRMCLLFGSRCQFVMCCRDFSLFL